MSPTATTTYTLKATDAAGSVTSTQTITVNASTTSGATWYIATAANGGDDSNEGTQAAPFATFAHALAGMSGCDTLIVENGYYYDRISVPSTASGNASGSGCYTMIEAQTPWGVTVDGSTSIPTTSYSMSTLGIGGSSDNYIEVTGIKFAGNPANTAGGGNPITVGSGAHHIKLIQLAAYNAPCTQNVATVTIGPAASYILIEDSHAWGCGRYKFLAYQSDHVILRRDVARHDYHDVTGWPSITGWGRQCADFTTYDSQYTVFQNDIAIDSGMTNHETGNMYGGLWSEHNDGSIDNPIIFEGSIVDNVQGSQAIQDAKQSGVHTFINDAVANSNGGMMMGRPTYGGTPYGPTAPTVSVTHMTFANILNTTSSNVDAGNGAEGIGIEGISELSLYTSQTVENNILQNISSVTAPRSFALSDWVFPDYDYYYDNTQNIGGTFYGGITPTPGPHDVQGVDPQIKYITREESGTPVYGTASDGGNIGATILYEIGTTGTMWGDPGYDTVTGTSLWPFPNESVIKSDMASFSMVNPLTGNTISGTRGFGASGNGLYGGPITLTSYIWEALGNPCPAGPCQ